MNDELTIKNFKQDKQKLENLLLDNVNLFCEKYGLVDLRIDLDTPCFTMGKSGIAYRECRLEAKL